MEDLQTISIAQDQDIVTARAAARNLAKTLGFGMADQTRLATAVSELTRNILRYAKNGNCYIEEDSDDQVTAIKIVIEDQGPGIPDIELAMQDGYTSGSGLGAGLPGTKRLVHEFDIMSEPGHTRISIRMTSKKKRAQVERVRMVSGRRFQISGR